MKVTLDIDCTPEEARRLMGLPDVSAMNEELVAEMHKRVLANLDAMDPQAILRAWMPTGAEGWEQFQKTFWSNLASAGKKPKTE